MAVTNQERVGKAMDLLRAGLAPFVEREVQSAVKAGTMRMDAVRRFSEDPLLGQKAIAQWDAAGLLKLMWETWNEVFGRTLGRAERSLVQELRDWRNKWAHQEPLSSDDTDRALDSMNRLLAAVSAPQADEIGKMKMELRRLVFDEQVRGEKRKAGGSLIEPTAAGNLRPWREVVTPHADVASGRYQQAEFAADLWQVHLGEGSDEYRKPTEFFRRTFLTESLKRLLVGGVRRLSGRGGDPVVQLQTNFGGGKTHSMLALYHLFGGAAPSELAGVDAVLAEAGVKSLPRAKRVVLVGNKISPGNPVTKRDGTVVRTLWGELAYQLGGAKAFARIAKDDEKATSPGDVLRELFVEYGPCLVLVDEWVAYARQLHDQSDLPAGGFETQFTFAQALTESAKLANNCLLVVSLPASDVVGSPHTQAEDVEVGGIRGREALDRLRNVVGRVESSWRPATAEEGFEIVRRRLFEPIAGEMFKQRDLTARAFADLYQAQAAEFPPECRSGDYEKRIKAAYPIHPEIFDRLYTDWSTLVKFQRTRGVLRLMAAVIHSLWEKGDHSPLILPSTIPIDDPRVQFELTRYLSDNWVPIIEKDIDGPNSLPLRIDADVPNLGKLSATRRVARTIYLGSAPTAAAAHRGLEDRRVKLGCVMPGETPAVFGDALRRLAAAATYLYQDGPRVWYATQPTVTKLAEDLAEQLKRDPDKVTAELDTRVRTDLKRNGDFSRVHALPRSGADVPDDLDARLVVLPAEQSYGKESGSAAELAAKAILESRGTAPRLYHNTLVFIAGVRNRDHGRARVFFAAFIEKATETAADLVVTPEYSLPWDALVEALLGGKVPARGKLWVFGCESLTRAELNERRAQLVAATLVLFEDLGAAGNRFLDPLVYVFVAETLDGEAEKLVLLVQFKTHPMGDPAHLENAHLQLGRAVYEFGNLATGLRLVSLVCSDVFGFNETNARQIYDRALVIHVQLNPQPRQHQYRFYREMLFRFRGDETELVCLNWAGGVSEWVNGEEKAWRNPSGSAWYLRPREFDAGDATLCANHRRGLYYTWLDSSRAHALFFNYDAGVYLLEATKVAHRAVPASVSRRVGPKLRGIFAWEPATGALSERQAAADGFSAVVAEADGAQADLLRIYERNPLAAERVLALCAGKICGCERWYAVGALDSFGIDSSEIIRRLTFCQDADPAAAAFRVARLRRCANLWLILADRTKLPAALSDVRDGFQLDWQESRPHQNLISAAGKPATVIYLGEEEGDAQIEAVATSIAEWLRRSAANDDEGIAARQRTAVWYRREGEVMLHARDRYVRFDDPRSRSEVDLARQSPG